MAMAAFLRSCPKCLQLMWTSEKSPREICRLQNSFRKIMIHVVNFSDDSGKPRQNEKSVKYKTYFNNDTEEDILILRKNNQNQFLPEDFDAKDVDVSVVEHCENAVDASEGIQSVSELTQKSRHQHSPWEPANKTEGNTSISMNQTSCTLDDECDTKMFSQFPDNTRNTQPMLRFSNRIGYKHISPSVRLARLLPDNFWTEKDSGQKHAVQMLGENALCEDNVHGNDILQIKNWNASTKLKDDKTRPQHVSPELAASVFLENETIVLKRYAFLNSTKYRIVTLCASGVYQDNNYGDYEHDAIIGNLKESDEITTSGGVHLTAWRLTIDEYQKLFWRYTCSSDSVVCTNMLWNLGVCVGSRIVECGSGSGNTTLLLSQAVGYQGAIESIEREEKIFGKAEESVVRWRTTHDTTHPNHPWPDNVMYHKGDLKHREPSSTSVDMVYLDVADPIELVETSVNQLRVGGCLAVYSPSPIRLAVIARDIDQGGLPMMLENMWEETHTTWSLANPVSKVLHVGRPEPCEQTTAYLGKFRKIVHFDDENVENLEPADVCGLNEESRLRAGDNVVVRPLIAKKIKKMRSFIITLKPGGSSCFHLGVLSYDDIIGRPEGSVVPTSIGKRMVIVRPELNDILETQSMKAIAKTKYNTVLSPRLFNLMCHLVDVRSGDQVLEISPKPGPMTAILARAVGEGGGVHSIITELPLDQGQRVLHQYLDKARQLMPKLCLGHVVCHDANAWDMGPVSAVCLSVNNAVEYLPFIQLVLPVGKMVAVACPSIHQIQIVLDFLSEESNSWLNLLDITQDTERPWILRRADPFGVSKETPYVCRPRQHIKSNTGFIARLKRIR